ncbi:hypothetical protein [Bordetella sp. LUAb4]|uniref:hypothetical protein n=1 Tax=Bordetella sp. LUAb4 TaxID=2843195 RepID=UPI001E292981|nr:hypothetical protein [Bordetella sp. LUAb4]
MPSQISGNSNALQNTGNIDRADAGHPPAGTADGPVGARDSQPRAGLTMQSAAGNTAPRAVLEALPSNARANARVDMAAAETPVSARVRAPLPPAPPAIMDMPADVEMAVEDSIIIPPTSQARQERIAQLETQVDELRTSNTAAQRRIEAQRRALEDIRAARRALEGNANQRQVLEAMQAASRALDGSAPDLG